MLIPRFRWLPFFKKSSEGAPSQLSRATRFRLEVPITFAFDELRLEGECLNISESGLLATFKDPPELWIDGQLFLEAGGHYLDIYARVARRQDRNVGFAFSINNDNDRATIAILINAVCDSPLD